jgi:hypothetical protein
VLETAVAVDHRQLGVELFNRTWTFLERPERTPADVDAMLHAAYASRYHWSQASEDARHQARGEWLLARVLVVAGLPDSALFHAQRCLDWCGRGEVEDWDRAFAHEALARAHAAAGNSEEAGRHKQLARELGDAIADPEDREQFDRDWATL